jgi:hypothetical protein
MKAKNILLYTVFFGGLALLVSFFFVWRGESTPDNIFYLNLAVGVITYLVVAGTLLLRDSRAKESEGSMIGAWGVKWVVLTAYPIASIGAMLLMSFLGLGFTFQLFVHIILILLLAAGFAGVFATSDKIRSVQAKQDNDRNGVLEMKRAISDIQDAILDCPEATPQFKNRINEMDQALRFISPSDSQQARDYQEKFVQTAFDIQVAMKSFEMNADRIEVMLQKLDRIYNQRKNTYSN